MMESLIRVTRLGTTQSSCRTLFFLTPFASQIEQDQAVGNVADGAAAADDFVGNVDTTESFADGLILRPLAVQRKIVGRKRLEKVGTLFTPDTILR